MAQLTMEAITATLNPKVSYFDMAAANQTQKHISEVSTFIPLSFAFSLNHAETYLLHTSANNSLVRIFTSVYIIKVSWLQLKAMQALNRAI